MKNNITPNKEWYIEISQKDGVLFCTIQDRVTIGKKKKYHLYHDTTDTEVLIGADESEKLMFDAIDMLTPDRNIYVNSRIALNKFPGTKYSFWENTFSSLADKKYEKIVRNEVKKDNITLVADLNYRHTFFLGDKKELIKKYFEFISYSGEFFGDCIFVPKRKKPLLEKELKFNYELIEKNIYSNCANDTKWFRQLKKQLADYPFILYGNDFSVEFITTLYSKTEALRRLKKAIKPYGFSLYVGKYLFNHQS